MRAQPGERIKDSDKRLLIIYLIIFTEILGFSIVLPVLPFLALSLGLNYFQIGLVLAVFSICQLFASPVWGKLSDRYGRKPILILSQISTFIGFILLGIATTVIILILARVVDGLLGSNMTVAQAYLSDITKPQDRTRVYSYSSAVFGLALIIGPLIGGILSTIDYSVPMFVAAGVCLVSIILVVLFLPESHVDRGQTDKITFNDIIPIKDAKRFLKDPKVRGILVIFFVYSFAFMLFISTFALYADSQLKVTVLMLGLFMAFVGILRVIFQVTLNTRLQKRLGDELTLKIGVLTLIIAMVLLAFITEPLIVFIPLIFLAFGTGVGRPILTSKLSKSVEREETGALMGVNNALSSIAMIITPILGGALIFYVASQSIPVLSAALFCIIFVLWGWAFTKPFSAEENID